MIALDGYFLVTGRSLPVTSACPSVGFPLQYSHGSQARMLCEMMKSNDAGRSIPGNSLSHIAGVDVREQEPDAVLFPLNGWLERQTWDS